MEPTDEGKAGHDASQGAGPAHGSAHANGSAQANGSAEANGASETGPARELTLHLLRMLETRMDAAGIAIDHEVQSFSSRVQLRLLAAGALFIAVWGAIVLIAIALPDPWRIPVLAAVIVLFVIAAVWAQAEANRRASNQEVGSLRWFVDSVKLDLEVLARMLAQKPAPAEKRKAPDDLSS